MIQELLYTGDELPPALKCQILSFMRVVWWEGFAGENRLRDWISHPANHPAHIVLVEQNILIAHTEVVWKYLDHAGVRYKAYGLSGVFTYPAFRGQGYGRRIVDAGTAYIVASDADIGIFHCDQHLEPFYTDSGWTPIHGATTYFGSGAQWTRSEELMMMRCFTEKGRRGHSAFESEPLYFGESTW
jgi:GNAT superfamily N-acetyltransferase